MARVAPISVALKVWAGQLTAPRTMAFAVNIFLIHALGDAVSPTLIGYVSDVANLKTALFGATAFLGLAAAFCFWGMYQYDRIS